MKKISVFLGLLWGLCGSVLAFQTANKAVNQVVAQGKTVNEQVDLLNIFADTALEQGAIGDAETATQLALNKAQATGYQEGLATAYDHWGLIAQHRYDYPNALSFFMQALKLKSAAGKQGLGSVYLHIGRVFALQNEAANAEKYYELAQGALGAADAAQSALLNRYKGDLFLTQKVYGKAISAYNEAFRLYRDALNDYPKAAELAQALGKVTADLGNYEEALAHFTASLDLHQSTNDLKNVGYDLLAISRMHLGLGDVDVALQYADNGFAAFTGLNDNLGKAEALFQAARIHIKRRDLAAAERYLRESAQSVAAAPVSAGVPALYRDIAAGLAEIQRFEGAFTYMNRYAEARDSLYQQEKARALIELTAKYESELSLRDKVQQVQDLEKAAEANRRTQLLLIFTVVLAVAFGGFAWRSYKRQERDNHHLAELNAAIQAQKAVLEEKNEEIQVQNTYIQLKNTELEEKNKRLDIMNDTLLNEISLREKSQTELFLKDSFLADITTRMRHPLSDIVQTAQALQRYLLPVEQKERVKSLQFAANYLLILINDVLNFSKIEAGKLLLSHMDFNPKDIIKEVENSVPSEGDVALNFTTQAAVPSLLHGDPMRLLQVLMYLLTNIKTHISKGHIAVTADFGLTDMSDNCLKINIKIEAIGHNFTLLNRIFTSDNAAQLEPKNKLETELVIARRLVEIQNGRVLATASPAGLEILCLLPFGSVSQKSEGVVLSEPTADTLLLAGKRILVVEDHKVNQILVAKILKSQGAFVQTADDGLQGLECFNKLDFDLVLMDIQMPHMDGYRAVAEIRRTAPAHKQKIPIIALTASAYLNEKEKAELFGMTDHIGKPFAPDELIRKITEVLALVAS